MRSLRVLAALLLAAAAPGVASAQCPTPTSPSSLPFSGAPDPMLASSEWSGLAFDAFTLDGNVFTTVQDGGRISTWNIASGLPPAARNVPLEVRDTIRRTHFIDTSNGWAVGQDGYVLRTSDGGASWSVIFRMPPSAGTSEPTEDLWDIHFLDLQVGFLAGLHGVWFTTNGGTAWTTACLLDKSGQALLDVDLAELEIYSLDIVQRTGGSLIGFLAAEPGRVFRTTDGSVWHEVFDVLDLCSSGTLPACAQNICSGGLDKFEPWAVEISRHPTDRLAVVVGGVGNGCGMVFASGDDGASFQMEHHECTCVGSPCEDCENDPFYLYHDDPNRSDDTFRRTSFGTLYDVAIFDGDNSAVAGGYGGSHVVRYPGAPPQVWRDRSSATVHILTLPPVSFVTTPLYGAAADDGDWQTGKAMIVGSGGYVRYTDDGGETWTGLDGDGGFRIRDVWFMDTGVPGAEQGWVVGQFSRIAVSFDGGTFWNPQDPQPALQGKPDLLAVSFEPLGQRGVTVGESPQTGGGPVILWTGDGGTTPWNTPTSVVHAPSGSSDGQDLREVDWAAGTEWWTAGTGGVILFSADDGDHWSQFVPRGFDAPTFQGSFEFEGLGFRDSNTGIFVGVDITSGAPLDAAIAYQYHRNAVGGVSWSSKLPAGHGIRRLTAVDVAGDVAYAVGWKVVTGGLREGVILRATASGGVFGDFALVPNHPAIPACQIGPDLNRIGVLSSVEILPSGDVMTVGECGRGWRFTSASGTWTELKTHTDSHVQGISAASSNATFFASHRRSNTNSSIVRVE